LVITDYANNLARIGELIATLDTPSATDVEVIPLQEALASDIAATVQKLSGPTASGTTAAAAPAGNGGGSGGNGAAAAVNANGVMVIADTHTNSLLVKGASPARLAAIRALVARLVRAGAARSNIHVVYLKYTDAARLATVLRAAFASDASKVGGSGGGGSSSPGSSGGGLGGLASQGESSGSSRRAGNKTS